MTNYINALDKKLVMQFKQNTGQSLNYFIDSLISCSQKKYVIDVIKFNDYCVEHLDYNEEGLSLNDFCLNTFGEEFKDFIFSLI